jgi:cytochrome P450
MSLITWLTAATTPPSSARPLAVPPPDSGLCPVPGDPGPPLVGYTPAFVLDPEPWGRHRYERYGPVSWSGFAGTRVVSALGPELGAEILLDRERSFSQSGWEHFIGPFFPGGLMLLDFDEHAHHRRIMQQAFRRDRLRAYLRQMQGPIRDGVAGWPTHRAFPVYPALKRLTLDVATTVFLGDEPAGRSTVVDRAFIDLVRAGTAFVRAPVPGGRWRRGLRARAVLEEVFGAELAAERCGDGEDLFSALTAATSEDGHRFTARQVIDHIIFLMMAAHDTSTITLSTMIYQLATHPDWQERAREESRALGEAHVSFGALDELATLDLVTRECLRLVAPVPSLPRRAVRDTSLLGHHIPAGTMVTANPYFTHHMHEWWPQPERFDPERFAPGRREDAVHPHAWMPFGGGAHHCIGVHFGRMEIKAVMHQLLLRYRWTVEAGYVMPLDHRALPKPADDLPITLEPLPARR